MIFSVEEMISKVYVIFVVLIVAILLPFSIDSDVKAEGSKADSWYPYLRVSILEYDEESSHSLDEPLLGYPYRNGDPYFHIRLDEDADGDFDRGAYSDTFDDTQSLTNPFSHDFIIFGELNSFKLQIDVWDEDMVDSDRLDYVPTDGYSYIHTRYYDDFKVSSETFGPYNGEDDGRTGEDDITLYYKVELFNWNVAPIVDDIQIYGKSSLNAYVYEPVYFFADVFDPNMDSLTYEWDFDDGYYDYSEVGFNIFTEPGTYSISLTVSDSLESTIEFATVHVSQFPYNLYSDTMETDSEETELSLDTTYSKTLEPGVSTEEYYIPWPFELTIWLSLVVDVRIDHTGSASLDLCTDISEGYDVESQLSSSVDTYTFSIKPHFEVNFLESGDPYSSTQTFDLPIPTTWQIYPGQPSLEIEGTTYYFWDRLVEVDTITLNDELSQMQEIENSFNVATIDLIPYIDALINYALPGWTTLMSTGGDFLDYIGIANDRVLNLKFNIDLSTIIWDEIWLHEKTTSVYQWNSLYEPLAGVWDSKAVASPIDFTYPLKVDVNYTGTGYLTEIYPYLQHTTDVRVSGSIDLEYGYTILWDTDIYTTRLFDSSDYGLYLDDSDSSITFFNTKVLISPPPDFDNDGIPDERDPDDDNDGVPDTQDAFPFDPHESLDTDNDGIGNNADNDDDGDGVPDTRDDFPLDPTETIDTDNDGIGNNADTDDDNDGVEDLKDYDSLDPNVTSNPMNMIWMILIIVIVVVVVTVAIIIKLKTGKKPPIQQPQYAQPSQPQQPPPTQQQLPPPPVPGQNAPPQQPPPALPPQTPPGST